MRPGRLGFILAAIAGLFLVVPGVMLPMFTTVFVNTILNSPTGTNAAALVTAVFVVSLLIGVLTLVQQWFLARLQTRLTVSGSFRLVDHLLHLPVQYFTQRFPGVIVSRLDQVDSITQLLAGPLVTAGVATVGLVVYAAVMIAYSPLLAGLAVIASLLNVAALWYVSRRRDAANQLQLRESSRLTGLGMSMVSNIEAVKTSGAEDSAFERWAGFQARYLLASQDMGRLTNGLSVVPTTLSSFTSVLVLAIGGVGGHVGFALARHPRRVPGADGLVPVPDRAAGEPRPAGADGAGTAHAGQRRVQQRRRRAVHPVTGRMPRTTTASPAPGLSPDRPAGRRTGTARTSSSGTPGSASR